MVDRAVPKGTVDEFERTTRRIRWMSIVVVLVTFPNQYPQAPYVYILLLFLALFNVSRYFPSLQQLRPFRSPVSIMVVDILFAGILIAMTGDIGSPYSVFFVYMVLTAAYLYRLPGVIAIVILEAIILFAVSKTWSPFMPIRLDEIRTIAITVFALFSYGYLVARLTHQDHQERQSLNQLRMQSDRERLRLKTLVDSLSTAIYVTDGDGKVVQYNEAAAVLAGDGGSLEGKSIDKVLPLFRRNDTEMRPVRLLSDESNVQHRRDLSITAGDKSRIDLDISVTAVQRDGAVTEYIFVCDDISHERSLEVQRTQFMSVAAHELRTPLAIVEASLESALSASKEMPVQTVALLDQAHRNALQLSSVMRDLAILAESKSDNIPIPLAKVNPRDMLDDCIEDFKVQASHKGIEFKKIVASDAPSVISTEPYIREILQNYLTNALKYSQAGTITLRADKAKNRGVLYSVIDEGVGISPHDQKLLFTKFFRAEDYRIRSKGGTGLGLYLCLELAQRMNAKLWCTSTLGKGSTFFLEVPQRSHIDRDLSQVVKARVANLVDRI